MNDLPSKLRKYYVNGKEWYGIEIDVLTEAADHIEAQNKLIQEMREAFEQYEAALRNRQHGVVAMGRLAADIGFIYAKSNPNTPERNDE